MTAPPTPETLTSTQLALVAEDLDARGWWYPPDAIQAAAEHRDRYWMLGGPANGVRLRESARVVIRASIAACQARGWERLEVAA